MSERRQGCLSGLLQLFLVKQGYDYAQRNWGMGRGGCGGIGCGLILFVILILALCFICSGTDWFSIRF